MTTYYVNSAASGANNGTSKTDAYISLLTAVASKANADVFEVAHTHDETVAGAVTLTLTAGGDGKGVLVRSINFATDVPTFGAKLVLAANPYAVSGVTQGLNFDNSGSANNIDLNCSSDSEFNGCTFAKQAAQFVNFSGAQNTLTRFNNPTIAAGTSYTGLIRSGGTGTFEMNRLVITGTAAAGAVIFTQGAVGHSVIGTISHSNVAAIATAIDQVTGSSAGLVRLLLSHCDINASLVIEVANTHLLRRGSSLQLHHCRNGALSSPLWELGDYRHQGNAVKQSSKYRTGGGTDGTTSQAWRLTCAANRTWKQTTVGVRTPAMYVPVTTAHTSLYVYLAHNGVGAGAAGALNDDECWADAYIPLAAGAYGTFVTSMRALGGTPAVIPADAVSAWTGASLGTKQRIALTIAPTIAGYAIVYLNLANGGASDIEIHADSFVGVA